MANAKKQLLIAYFLLFSLIVLVQGNIAAMDLDGAVDVQKRRADYVVAIKTHDVPSRVKRQVGCDPTAIVCGGGSEAGSISGPVSESGPISASGSVSAGSGVFDGNTYGTGK